MTGICFKDGRNLYSHFRISGKSLDKGLVPLMSEENVVNLLNYVPRYREIEENVVEKFAGKEEGKCCCWDGMIPIKLGMFFRMKSWICVVKPNLCKDGIQIASVSRGEEADKYPCMELDQDLFQQDNVVDAEDYIDMVDELQQGNEDVVVEREEQVIEDTQEAETVDEIDASDESEFKPDEIPLIEP
ncbi:hypothetical protein Tco_1344606 [Tanacetum coccineum]